MKFKKVCLFGFSQLFLEIETICKKYEIELFILSGDRQLLSINKLGLKISSKKFFILNSLDDNALENIIGDNSDLIGVSFGSPFIFNQEHIDFFSGNLINQHGAPLPEFKGGGGFSWRILQEDKRGASLMHYVSTKIDEGDIVFKKNFDFDEKDILPKDYEIRQNKEDQKNILPWLESILNGRKNLNLEKEIFSKNDGLETYFPRLMTNIHGYINWDFDIHSLQNFIRAFSRPYPGATTFLKGNKLRILNCTIYKEKYINPFLQGLITDKNENELQVMVKGGILKINKNDIVYSNKKLDIRLGDRFFTPNIYLEKALNSRVFFKPSGEIIRTYENLT